MLGVPLLIGHDDSDSPLLSMDAFFNRGCHGIRIDLQLKPFASSRANHERSTRYPRLQDLFDHCGDRLFLDIGLTTTGMEPEILNATRQRDGRQNYVVSSSIPEVVMELKARSAVIQVGFVCKRAGDLAAWRQLPADYISVHHLLITRKLIRSVQGSARKIFAAGVNDAKSMLRLAGWGVDGIISNNARLLAKTLGSLPLSPGIAPISNLV